MCGPCVLLNDAGVDTRPPRLPVETVPVVQNLDLALVSVGREWLHVCGVTQGAGGDRTAGQGCALGAVPQRHPSSSPRTWDLTAYHRAPLTQLPVILAPLPLSRLCALSATGGPNGGHRPRCIWVQAQTAAGPGRSRRRYSCPHGRRVCSPVLASLQACDGGRVLGVWSCSKTGSQTRLRCLLVAVWPGRPARESAA